MIHIRADGNARIGTGHVMRCLSVAQALREQGTPCRLVAADQEPRPLVERAGFALEALGSDWHDLPGELPALFALLDADPDPVVLVDSYQITGAYLRGLKNRAKVAVLDDLDLVDAPVDLLVNYNVYAGELGYRERFHGVRLFLGCRYAPLRPQFVSPPPFTVRPAARDILLTTGGTDPHGATVALLQACVDKRRRFHVVAGRYSPHRERLRQLEAAGRNIRVHEDVSDMAALMTRCDLAVSAAGTTLYELCACGVPAICYVLADNQLRAARCFRDRGIMRCAGDIRDGIPAWTRAVLDQLDQLVQLDAGARAAMSRAARNLVDGGGAQRLAAALAEM